jgi:hypothetical protein
MIQTGYALFPATAIHKHPDCAPEKILFLIPRWIPSREYTMRTAFVPECRIGMS